MTRRRTDLDALMRDGFLEETEGDLRADDVARVLTEAGARTPSPALRDRLVASLATTHRFDDLEAECARLLDLPAARTAALLLGIDDPSVWAPGPGPDVELYHVDGGAAVSGAVTGFVRIPPGRTFPEHEHLGDEVVLVLQGAFEDARGGTVRAGEVARMPGGSSHSLRATGPVSLVYLAIVQKGVVIGGDPILPGDPRA